MSSTEYVVSDNVSPDEWKRVADRCHYATFFHTPAWYQAFARVDGDAGLATRRLDFADGRSAIVPLLARRVLRGLVTRHEAAPAGCYGGWISADELERTHVDALCRFVTGRLGELDWRINPFDPAAEYLELFKTDDDSTEVLMLDRFVDEDDLRRHYRHSVRKQINKGERFGLGVRLAEGWEDWKEYYGIHGESLKRWGDAATSSYSIDFFRALFDAGDDGIGLWLVTAEDRIVGGNLNFYHGKHCVEWHAVFLDEYFRVGARNFLVHSIIRDAKDRGFTVYDFNPSGDNEGTRRFKRNFGTDCLASNLIQRRHFDAARGVLRRARELARSRRRPR